MAAANKAAPAAGGEERASIETFVVMYYFTVAPGPTDYQVTIKVRSRMICEVSQDPSVHHRPAERLSICIHMYGQSDVYLNDLTAVEFGAGADFTLAFDQTSTPLQLAAPSQALRDEIVWNLLTVRAACGPTYAGDGRDAYY